MSRITEYLMKPGRFEVQLDPETPPSIVDDIGFFDHLVVCPTWVPANSLSDANMLSRSIYTGCIQARPDRTTFTGLGLSMWLGTDDGRGDLLDTAVSNTAGNLATWVNSLRPSSLSAGTVTSPGGTLSYNFQWVTRREALDYVCRALGAEWRVNPNGTLDAATAANLFVTTPTTVITRHPAGRDAGLRSFEVVDASAASDVEGYITKAIVVARNGDGAQMPTGTATGSNVYKDLNNNNVVFERLVNAPDTAAAAASTVASGVLGLYSSVRRSLRLSSRTFAVPVYVRPGDYVYVYDPLTGLVDTANQIRFRGSTVPALKLRCRGYTWPLLSGMGVYVRKSGATPTYIDVTKWVRWEIDPTTEWEVGASVADPDQDPSQLSPAYLGSNPAIADRTGATGVIGITDSQTSTSAYATGIGNTETYINLATPARETLAGRRYRLHFQFEIRALQNLTSFCSVRIRRGTGTGGTTIFGPISFPKGAGTAPRILVDIWAYDSPGAQASQQWCATLLNDNAALIDAYAPAFAVVEDCGPA